MELWSVKKKVLHLAVSMAESLVESLGLMLE
jgi:hypothetical protein